MTNSGGDRTMAKIQHACRKTRDHRWLCSRTISLSIICLLSSGLLVGCVSSGKYEGEKARALNFQRLLAQEEKRTAELSSQIQETKRQLASLESQNTDLTIEIDALREQQSRQERATSSDSGGSSLSGSSDLSLSEPSLSDFGLNDLSFDESDFNDFGEVGGDSGGEPTYYTVERGDTLYRISREYGVTVAQLKDWNNLSSNTISIGQQLVVSNSFK